MQSLVYDCITENVILSTEEFKYVLSRIRAFSLGENIDIDFYCSECGKQEIKTFKLIDIIRGTYKPLKEIKVKNVHIKLGEIKNKDFYIKKIQEDENFDFLLRIEEFNSDRTFTLEKLIDIIDNLDIDILTEILEIYEDHKFKIDDINVIECDCGFSEKYEFDELPGFFPESWFE